MVAVTAPDPGSGGQRTFAYANVRRPPGPRPGAVTMAATLRVGGPGPARDDSREEGALHLKPCLLLARAASEITKDELRYASTATRRLNTVCNGIEGTPGPGPGATVKPAVLRSRRRHGPAPPA